MAAVSLPAASRAGKYLTFLLGAEEYGLEIVRVREIHGILPITSMPQAPHYVKGVINLRGKVFPVVDIRMKFGMPEKEHTPETCIIVVDVGDKSFGLLVDTVKEVVDIREEQIEDPPHFGAESDSGFIRGLGKVGGQVKILLSIEQALSDLSAAGLPL